MTEAENLLAELIWESEPIRSGDLVKLASQRLGWKKSTTYSALRKICENDIFQNKAAVVTSKMSREEYTSREEHTGRKEERFKKKEPVKNEIEEIVTLVEEHKE